MSFINIPEPLGREIVPVLQEYEVNSVYLFGSRVDGTAAPNSDYDLDVLLRKYDPTKHNALFASTLEVDLQTVTDAKVDILLLQRASIILRFTIIKEGKVIYCVDEDFRTDFEDVVIRDYLDFKPFLDMYYREMQEAIQEGDFNVTR